MIYSHPLGLRGGYVSIENPIDAISEHVVRFRGYVQGEHVARLQDSHLLISFRNDHLVGTYALVPGFVEYREHTGGRDVSEVSPIEKKYKERVRALVRSLAISEGLGDLTDNKIKFWRE